MVKETTHTTLGEDRIFSISSMKDAPPWTRWGLRQTKRPYSGDSGSSCNSASVQHLSAALLSEGRAPGEHETGMCGPHAATLSTAAAQQIKRLCYRKCISYALP